MKAFLYTGAALMIGAGIYGFADYNQTSSKKEFRSMYAGEAIQSASAKKQELTTAELKPVATPSLTSEKKEAINTTSQKAKKIKKKKRTFSTRLFSRGALDERYIVPPPAEIKTDKPVVKEKENR